MDFIDMIDKDCLISDMEQGRLYLVGIKNNKDLYLCRRVRKNLLVCNFRFNLQYDFVLRIENLTDVYGFSKRDNAFFSDRVVFSKQSIVDLLYNKLPNFKSIPKGTSYIRELLPAVSIQQFEQIC